MVSVAVLLFISIYTFCCTLYLLDTAFYLIPQKEVRVSSTQPSIFLNIQDTSEWFALYLLFPYHTNFGFLVNISLLQPLIKPLDIPVFHNLRQESISN